MSKFAPSEDEFFDSDDIQKHSLLGPHAYAAQKQAIMDSRYVLPSGGGIKREFRRQPVQSSWLHKLLYYLNQVTNKRPEELIYDTKESITSLVKSNEEIMIESQNKEEATTSNRKNLRTTSEIKKFVTKKYREVFNHLVDTKNAMDDVATIPVLKEKIYEMDNKEDEIYEMDKKVEEYDEDTTRVGPFKVRTTQAPTVDDRKLLELCFGKVEEDTVMVGVKDHEAFNVNKNMFCNGLKPEGWISNVFINCVADMLCIRECIKGDVQRWFFPMHTREYRILSQKRSRKQKRSQNQPEYCITKQQLQSVKQIFFPTYKDNHFYLIVFNTMEHRVEVWDTMKETENLDKYIEEIAHLCHFLDNDIGDGMLNEFKGYTGPIVIDVLQQDNTSDCGVFVCRSMEFPDEVMKLNKWITEEERCNMALRMLKASENVFSVEEAASNKLSKLNYAGKKGKKPRRKE